MTLIQHQELGSTQASITFSSIPQTYTDLYLVYSLRGNASTNSVELRFELNGSGGTDRVLYGFGSSGAGTNTAAVMRGVTVANTATSNTFGSGSAYIPNYTLTGAKSVLAQSTAENNNNVADIYLLAGTSSTTTAVTSLTIGLQTGSFLQYSSATLYGITKGSSNGVTVS